MTRTRQINFFFVMSMWAALAVAQVPDMINYQGRVVDGAVLVSGVIDLELSLWTNATGPGDELYVDSNKVTVVDGLYSTLIGDNTLTGSLIDALSYPEVYVGVKINGDSLTPREPLSSVAYAKRSPRTSTLVVAPYGSDYTNLQDAVDALPPEGGKVYISEGVYEHFDGFILALYDRTNIVVEGAGNGTQLRQLDNVDGIIIGDCENVALRNFRLYGADNCAGVYAYRTSDVKVENLTIDNFPFGVQLSYHATNSVVRDCRISTGTNSWCRGIFLDNWGGGLGHPGVIVEDNHIVPSAGWGIEAADSPGAHKVLIQGNVIETPPGREAGGIGLRGGQCRIVGNQIRVGDMGLVLFDTADALGQNVISDNVIMVGTNATQGMQIEGRDNVIANNNVDVPRTNLFPSGIYVINGPAAVSGNIVTMRGTNDAIVLDGQASNVAVMANTVFGMIKSASTNDSGNTFFGNILVNSNCSIVVDSADTTTEPGNNAADDDMSVDDLYQMNVNGGPGAP